MAPSWSSSCSSGRNRPRASRLLERARSLRSLLSCSARSSSSVCCSAWARVRLRLLLARPVELARLPPVVSSCSSARNRPRASRLLERACSLRSWLSCSARRRSGVCAIGEGGGAEIGSTSTSTSSSSSSSSKACSLVCVAVVSACCSSR